MWCHQYGKSQVVTGKGQQNSYRHVRDHPSAFPHSVSLPLLHGWRMRNAWKFTWYFSVCHLTSISCVSKRAGTEKMVKVVSVSKDTEAQGSHSHHVCSRPGTGAASHAQCPASPSLAPGEAGLGRCSPRRLPRRSAGPLRAAALEVRCQSLF